MNSTFLYLTDTFNVLIHGNVQMVIIYVYIQI